MLLFFFLCALFSISLSTPPTPSAAATGTSSRVQPFKIEIEKAVLDDLDDRLGHVRLFDSFDAGWTYGANLNYFRDLAKYWKDEYDWKTHEKELNAMEQFTVNFEEEDIRIHFVHRRSSRKGAVPLILLHGWPGSFWECSKVIDMLVDPNDSDLSFHFVCPSLPGYGFSSAPTQPGFDQLETAKVMIKLMQVLGYEKFYVQGGDWGAIVGALMAIHAPEKVIGYHTNFPLGVAPYAKGIKGILHTLAVFLAPSFMLPTEELDFWKSQSDFHELWSQTGYFHLQATKPHTVAIALNDSPVGLAAYIIEKFQRWSDCKGDLSSQWTKDQLLTNVMIYWVTGSIGSSQRFYYEMFYGKNNIFKVLQEGFAITVPTGCSVFPNELFPAIRTFAEYSYKDIVFWRRHPKGGHFAAMEEPKALVEDVREFRRIVEKRGSKSVEL